MSSPKPITIIGGGLAGLVLGIGLRRQGIPVVLWDAGKYPRHRVCGEFISGRGLETPAAMGMTDFWTRLGARPARDTIFFLPNGKAIRRKLPEPAYCISRYHLDMALARELSDAGGEVRSGQRWTGPAAGEGIVRATGRRMQSQSAGWRWYGLKGHAIEAGAALEADLEMHFGPNSYVGLCRLPGGRVNVCGLFRRAGREEALPRDPVARLSQDDSGKLASRFQGVRWDESSFCAVGGLGFNCRLAGTRVGTTAVTATSSVSGCAVGDALGIIPPVTGNGMSMALESALVARGLLARYAQREVGWETACGLVRKAYQERFNRRLFWADWLHRCLFDPTFSRWLAPFCLSSDCLWPAIFRATR